jgi:predicted N-acetyltransferase YhbS
MKLTLRRETRADYRAVEELTREAFWNVHYPGCDEHLLARHLREAGAFVPELDFVAVYQNKTGFLNKSIVGSIMYVETRVIGAGAAHGVLTFGPISVLPAYQNRGVGTALIEHTKARARKMGYPGIIIYGDPAYYGRFGFRAAKEYGITNREGRYPAALLALELSPRALDAVAGIFDEGEIYEVDQAELAEYEKSFPEKAKGFSPSQDRFKELSSKFL